MEVGHKPMIRLANKHDAAQILDIYSVYVENTIIFFELILNACIQMGTGYFYAHFEETMTTVLFIWWLTATQ
jgi:hypothetical protein